MKKPGKKPVLQEAVFRSESMGYDLSGKEIIDFIEMLSQREGVAPSDLSLSLEVGHDYAEAYLEWYSRETAAEYGVRLLRYTGEREEYKNYLRLYPKEVRAEIKEVQARALQLRNDLAKALRGEHYEE